MDLLDRLKWRYAAKKMNPQKIVPQEKVERILEAARLAPTSSGLQPFEIIVITNRELKEKIKAIAWNQSPVADGSHLLVFAVWDHYTADRINMMFDLTNQERGFKSEEWEKYRNSLLRSYTARDPELNFQHAARQAYIAFGVALVAAACEEVDSTPMEGFDNKALDETLNLRAKGLRSVLIMPLGYRDADQDWLVNLKKVRKHRAQLVTEID